MVGFSRTYAPPTVDADEPAPVTVPASSEEFFRRSALEGVPVDPHALRRCFPDQWRGFLRTHFRNVTDIAAFFCVEERTARNWLEGKNSPQGWAVAVAIRGIAGAAQWLEAA